MVASSSRTRKVPLSKRKASPSGWISDNSARERFICWKNIKGDCYPEVFYNNIKVVDGNIQSRVKGLDIVISNDSWLQVAGIKDEGHMSHRPDCLQNRWIKKKIMFKDYMRYPRRYKMEKGFLHRWLNKEEKIIAYIIDWVLLPGRFHFDKMTSEDLYPLNAIMFRISTNWVAVFKKHIIDVGNNNKHNLPYGVFISRILSLSKIDFTSETKITCNISNQIGKATLTCIGLKKTALGWIFSDIPCPTNDQDATPDSDGGQILLSPKSEFEKFVVNKFVTVSKRASMMKKSLMRMNNKMDEIIKNYVESFTSTEESTEEVVESFEID
ncbi:hypothetical protein LR48_Vigan10g072100 [Vigna angularis]|uniref:Uncharacterized protein n=1 Tax=Phaseolus angularis TaxID=3914 RepID=A0A0L9VJB9_PHAAN|nr:hypothetical protein LR48_Vigan10g072100 [Vigna angularis]